MSPGGPGVMTVGGTGTARALTSRERTQICETLLVLAHHFQGRDLSDMVVVSPDLGRAKDAAHFARLLGLPMAAGSKRRIRFPHPPRKSYRIATFYRSRPCLLRPSAGFIRASRSAACSLSLAGSPARVKSLQNRLEPLKVPIAKR